jgi:hypothetical protein
MKTRRAVGSVTVKQDVDDFPVRDYKSTGDLRTVLINHFAVDCDLCSCCAEAMEQRLKTIGTVE